MLRLLFAIIITTMEKTPKRHRSHPRLIYRIADGLRHWSSGLISGVRHRSD